MAFDTEHNYSHIITTLFATSATPIKPRVETGLGREGEKMRNGKIQGKCYL